MKSIKYLHNGAEVEMGWNEANEALAKREADGGEYIIEDDGQTEPEGTEGNDLSADEMAAAILEGVNEV